MLARSSRLWHNVSMRREKHDARVAARPRFYVTERGDIRGELSGEFVAPAARVLAPTVAEVRRLLVELRTRTGFTRAYLAGLLNVPKDTLRRWEDCSRSPSGAACRLIWWMHCAIFTPNKIKDTEHLITWGK